MFYLIIRLFYEEYKEGSLTREEYITLVSKFAKFYVSQRMAEELIKKEAA